jgi:hypothetical protein
MEGRRKPVNFGDLMYVATLVGRVWMHVRPREVSHSPLTFEEGLRQSVSRYVETSEEIYLV